jgi:hypothetical protein
MGGISPSSRVAVAAAGPARIESQVRDHFFQFLPGDAVAERGPQVEGQLFVAAQRDQAGDRYQAAVAFSQSGTFPDLGEQDTVRQLGQRRYGTQSAGAHPFQSRRHCSLLD